MLNKPAESDPEQAVVGRRAVQSPVSQQHTISAVLLDANGATDILLNGCLRCCGLIA